MISPSLLIDMERPGTIHLLIVPNSWTTNVESDVSHHSPAEKFHPSRRWDYIILGMMMMMMIITSLSPPFSRGIFCITDKLFSNFTIVFTSSFETIWPYFVLYINLTFDYSVSSIEEIIQNNNLYLPGMSVLENNSKLSVRSGLTLVSALRVHNSSVEEKVGSQKRCSDI